MEKVIYQNSNTNFASYLIYLKFNYKVILKESEHGKPKVCFQFEGDSIDQFNKAFNDYRFENVSINLSKFNRCKDEAFRQVRDTLTNYYNDKKSTVNTEI